MPELLKICFLADAFESCYLRDRTMLAHLLAKNGHRVTVYSSTYMDDRLQKKELLDYWDKKMLPAQVIRCKTAMISRLNNAAPFILYLAASLFFKNYDLIHIHGFGTFSSFLGFFYRLFHRNVRIVIVSDMNPAGFVRLRRTKIYKHIMLLPLKAADAVITFTEKEKDGLSSVGIENRKIRTIPMGIRFGDFSQIQKKVNPNEIVFGYLGKISPLKGAHRLVEPLSRIMNEFPLRVRVIFAGSLGLQQYAKSVLDNLAKCPNFKYIGPLRLHEVNDFFRRCDIVLVPSLMEGTPATPLEAMAAGKCVIASNIFPINEFIEHGKSGMLAESERQFYEYAKRMILHPNLIETIGKNARNKVSLHSWNHVVAAFTETYFRICQS